MAIDKNISADELLADITAKTEKIRERRASAPSLSLPKLPSDSINAFSPDFLEQYSKASGEVPNAWDDVKGFGINALNVIGTPGNYALDVINEYTDLERLTDPNKSLLDKLAYNPFSNANELLAKGWEKDGFFGALSTLSEEGKGGGEFVANQSKLLQYQLESALSGEDENLRQRMLKERESFKEEHPFAYYGGGFLSSALLDPLMFVSGGSASALKAGSRAALKEANALAKSAGIARKFDDVESAVNAIKETTKAKYASSATPSAVRYADKLSENAAQKALKQIDNAAKTARATAQNRLISLDVPFTKMTVPLAMKPGFLRKTADIAGENAIPVVASLTEKLQPIRKNVFTKDPVTNVVSESSQIVKTAQDRMDDLLRTRYGTTVPQNLTVDQVRDLQKLFDDYGDVVNKFDNLQIEKVKPKLIDETVTKQIQDAIYTPLKAADIQEAYSKLDPKVQGIVDNLLGKDIKPQEIPAILGNPKTLLTIAPEIQQIAPDLLKQEAKQLAKDIKIPTPKPVPKSIINKFDQLFVISENLGLESRTYEKAFTDLVDEFNSGKITKEDLLKRVSEDLKSTKQLLKENQVSAKSTVKPKAPKQPVVKEEPITEARVQTPSNQKPIDNVPFTKGENIYTSPSVTQDVAKVVEKWKNMLDIKGRMILLAVDENKSKSFYDLTIPLRDAIKNKSVKDVEYYNELLSALKEARFQMTRETSGLQLTLKNGDVIVIYRDVPDKQRMLSTISHELGHAVMDSAYKSAPENIRKAIDAEFEKFLVESKGKSAKQVLEKLMNFPRFQQLEKDPFRDLSLPMDEAFSKQFREYLISKDEWFAEQVAKWALSSKKPMSVVEKFFYDVAQKLKQFFQANKQFLPTKTMADWLNGLEKTAKQSIQPATEPLDMKFAKSELDSKTVPNETPQVKQKTTEPSNVITPEKKKYFEMLRSTLQPTGIPQVVKGLDKELVKQLTDFAKKIKVSEPTAKFIDEIVTKKVLDETGKPRKIDVALDRVVKDTVDGVEVYKTTRRTYTPYSKLKNNPAFVADMGGQSPVGRFFRSMLISRLFNARSLGTGDSFIDTYGDLIQQAKTFKVGELAYMQKDLIKINKIAQELTEPELRAAQYLVEGKFPKSYTEDQILKFTQNEKLTKFVDGIKNLMEYVGKEDLAADAVKNLRKDYFPHVLKFNEEQWDDFIKQFKDDKDLSGLIGKSEANKFGKQRTGFPTLAELDDTLVSLQTKLNDATDPRQIQNLEYKIKQLQNIFERDTLKAVASRVYTSARSRMMKQLYDQMRKDRLLRYTRPSRAPENFIKLTKEEVGLLGLKIKGGAESLYMHKDLLDALRRTEDIFSDNRLTNAIKYADDFMRVWKLGTTVLIPKHYYNNLIGNIFNMMLAGMNPKALTDATGILTRLRMNKLTEAEQGLVKEAYRNGIIGQGHNAEFDIFSDPAKKKKFFERVNDKIRSWAYTKALMYTGQFIDDASRLALYMDTLKKTGSTKLAENRVREYLFNYHEVTVADKLVRSTLLPFWLWTKNNIPLMMKEIFRNPRVFLLTDNARKATFDENELENKPDFIREKYIKNFFGQTVPFNLPMYDLNKFQGVRGTMGSFAADLNPVVKSFFEIPSNYQFFTGAPIDPQANRKKSDGEIRTEKLAPYLAKTFGGQLGNWVTDSVTKLSEDKTTLPEQAGRVASSYFYGTPYFEKKVGD